MALLIGLGAPAARAADEGGQLDLIGHASDGVYLDFAPFGKVELPRIFLIQDGDGNWDVRAYASTASALASGQYDVVTGEDVHLPSDDVAGIEELIASHEHVYAELVPADGGRIVVDFSITRHLVFGLLAAVLCVIIFVSLARRYARGIGRDSAPRGIFQNLFEALIVFVRDDIARPNLGDKYARFLPYLLTAFFFILFCNLIGLVPFGAAATANIAVTGVLAMFTFFVTQFSGSRDYWAHVFWPPGVPVPIKFILIPVEVLGLFTKPFALAVRLFANMSAGYLVILSLIGLIFIFTALFGSVVGVLVSPVSVALAVFIYLLKVLVAFIQAYVFTALSALFIGMAVEEHHAHEGHTPEWHETLDHDAAAAPSLPLSGDGASIAGSSKPAEPAMAG